MRSTKCSFIKKIDHLKVSVKPVVSRIISGMQTLKRRFKIKE